MNYIQPGAGFGSHQSFIVKAFCPVHATLQGRHIGTCRFPFSADCGHSFDANGNLSTSGKATSNIINDEPGAATHVELDTGRYHKP